MASAELGSAWMSISPASSSPHAPVCLSSCAHSFRDFGWDLGKKIPQGTLALGQHRLWYRSICSLDCLGNLQLDLLKAASFVCV